MTHFCNLLYHMYFIVFSDVFFDITKMTIQKMALYFTLTSHVSSSIQTQHYISAKCL